MFYSEILQFFCIARTLTVLQHIMRDTVEDKKPKVTLLQNTGLLESHGESTQ